MRTILILVTLAACGPAMPKGHYADTISETKSVTGLTVTLKAAEYYGWQIALRNETDEQMQIMWMTSSFVGSNCVSYGRLVAMNPEQALVVTLVPPHSTAAEFIRAEGFGGRLSGELAGVVNDGTMNIEGIVGFKPLHWSAKLGVRPGLRSTGFKGECK